MAAALGPVLAAGFAVAVASVATAPAAKAQTGPPVLVLVQNGETTAPESTVLQAAGYTVTQATPSAWAGMTSAQFEGYAALVIGDPSTGGSCSSLTPTTGASGSDALGTAWQSALSGNVAVLGTAPALPGTTAANTLISDSAGYAAAGFVAANSGTASSGTGLYLSLNCEYSAAPAGTAVPLLAGVEGIGTAGLTVQGNLACTDPGTVNAWEASKAGTFGGFTSDDLAGSAWGTACPVQEAFGSWPAMFTPVAYDSASDATANFTASDGTTGQPYVLLGKPVSTATAALAPSAGGEVIGGTTAGGISNPAAPGVQQASAGDPVNTENGDFSQSATDVSLPGVGPPLEFSRSYDAVTAQQDTQAGTPGPVGYGWTDNWATSLATAQPTPGSIYGAAGLRTGGGGDGGQANASVLSSPAEVAVDGAGDIFIADTSDNRVQEIAGPGTSSDFGQSMVPGDVYTVAGQANGQFELSLDGGRANGTPATGIVLNHPQGVAIDSAGNLYIADTNNSRVVEVANRNQTQYGISMSAGDAYTIAGSAVGSTGTSGDGGPAVNALLNSPTSLHFGAGSHAGDLYIADAGNNRIQEIPAASEVLWAHSGTMVAGDVYTVAGSASGTAGGSVNGTVAPSTQLRDPQGVTIDGNGNMFIADTVNCRIAEIAASSGTQWGSIAMTANDLYTVAGRNGTGNCMLGNDAKSATASDLADPTSVRDPNGNLYIADSGENRVQEVAGNSSAGTIGDVYTIAGNASGAAGVVNNPRAIWIDSSGNLYISQDGVQSIPLTQGLTELSVSTGQITSVAGGAFTLATFGNSGPATLAGLNGPAAVTSDSHGDVYIADTSNNEVQEIAASTHSQFSGAGLVSETGGDIYDIAGDVFGSAGSGGDGEPASEAELSAPSGVAVDASGDIYIADTGNGIVREVSGSTGDISTVAGTLGANGTFSGSGGPATSAVLGSPEAVAVDAAGNVFITDSSNNDVYEVPAASGTQYGISMTAGDIYIIAGSSGLTAPAAPTGLTVTGTTASSVSLSWTAPSGTVTGYDVYENGTQVTAAGGTSVTISGLSASTTYTFAVAAFNGAGTGARSSSVQASTSSSGGTVPGAPTGLTVTGTTASSVSLSWTAPSGTVTGYDVYENGAQVSTASGTSATVTGLSASTTYTFAVAAFNGAGTGARSSSVQATTSSSGGGNGAPTGLTVTGTTASSVSLSWTAPTGSVLGYLVYENGTEVQTASGTTATVTGLAASTTYTFTVAASTFTGTGPQSAPVQATTAASGGGGGAGVPAAPTGLTATDSDFGFVALAWTAPPGTVTGYDVYVDGTLDETASTTSAIIEGLPSGTYTITVAAFNSAGTGPQSSPAQVTVGGGAVARQARSVPALARQNNPSGNSGDGGPATAARLNNPTGLAVDSAGNVYVSDSGNNQVREIAATSHTQWGQSMTGGDIYTIAGNSAATSGSAGDGGPATASYLNAPQQIALDTGGDLYIADENNQAIREVADANGTQWSQSMTAGDIYDVAGTITTEGALGNGGPAASAQMFEPFGIGTDPTGDLYILQFGIDWAVSQLQEVTATAAPSIPAAPGQTSSLAPLSTASGGITVTQPDGSKMTFQAANAGGACTLPYVPSGRYCVLPQSAGATLTDNGATWTYSPSPGSDSYTYSGSSGQLVAEADPAGDSLTISYDTPAPGSGSCPTTAGSCETITAASGRTLVIGSSSAGRVTSVTDPMGRSWTYAYNSAGQLSSATDPMHSETSYTYGQGGTGNSLLASDLLTITSPNAQPGGPDAGDATVNVYDSLGRVTSQTDPMGFKTTFDYCVSAAAGDCMDPATGTGFVTVTDPDHNTTVYDYDQGTLAAETQLTAQTVVSEQDYNPLTWAGIASGGTLLDQSVTDGNGNTSTYTYNGAGDVTSTTAPGPDGPTTTTNAFTELNQDDCDGTAQASATATCTQVTPPTSVAPGGVIAPPTAAPPEGLTYTLFDTNGSELYSTTGVYQPGSSSASYLQTTYQLFNGNSVTLNGTSVACASRAPAPLVPCAEVSAGDVVTQLGYDSAGDLVSSAVPDGNGSEVATTTYAYNADGEQTSSTSPDGNLPGANAGNYTTVSAYNADGQKTIVTQAGGPGATAVPRPTPYGYDADGNATTIQDARGFTTTTSYNADDKATLVTNSDGATLTCYDGDGNAAQTVPAAGVAAGSLTPASCPASYPAGYSDRLAADATVSTFNAAGSQVQQTTPAPAGQSGSETTTYAYDGDGNLIQTTAPPAISGGPDQVTVDSYTSAGQLASQTIGHGGSAPSTTTYCYDPDGHKTAVVAPDGNTAGIASCETVSPWTMNSGMAQAAYQTTYSYDSVGEVVATTTPATDAAHAGATTTSTYGPTGNLLTSTDPDGVTTTYTYTPGNLKATVRYSGSSAAPVTYTYDADGSKTGMTDGTGTSSFAYDPFGELTSATNGAGQVTSYGYSADRQVTSISYPLPSTATWATSDTVSYGYNHADQLTSVTDFTGNMIAITNNADGLPVTEALGATGDTISTTYDSNDAASSIALANSSSVLQSFTYADGPSGDIVSETDAPASSTSPDTYSYDSHGRVTSMTPGTGSADDYGFDASGNLATLPGGAGGTYDHGGELTSAALAGNTTSYGYNADGERLTVAQGSSPLATATWNGTAQLAAYNDQAADMTTASYDGNGLRAASTTTSSGGSTVTQDYVWDTVGQVPQLIMDSSSAYIYAASGTPAEQLSLSTGTVTWLIADSLGSVRGAVNSSGALTATTSYDAWGNPETTGGLTAITPFGYGGSYADPTGLIYLINRYYDPLTGQFISVDPDVSATEDPYVYTGDDPVNSTDPTGLYTFGMCLGAQGELGEFHVGAGGCLTRTLDGSHEDDVGITRTALTGIGEGRGFGAGEYMEVSNATNLQQLTKWFWYVSLAGSVDVYGFTVNVFWGGGVYGFDLGSQAGEDAYVAGGKSYTWVNQFHQPWAEMARYAWSALTFGDGIIKDRLPGLIGLAKSIASRLHPWNM